MELSWSLKSALCGSRLSLPGCVGSEAGSLHRWAAMWLWDLLGAKGLVEASLTKALMKRCVAVQQSRSLSWTLVCQVLCSQEVLLSEREQSSLPTLMFLWQGMRQGQSCLVQAL